jgi:hypothetical protein
MTPDNRRLLLDWLEAEERQGRPLSTLLQELREKRPELALLARYLAAKETEERAQVAVLERARWFRSFSWRMVVALFAFGVAGMVFFLFWRGEQAFLGSIFFFAGGASYYLLVQAMATRRSQRDQKALAEIRRRCQEDLHRLRRELGP